MPLPSGAAKAISTRLHRFRLWMLLIFSGLFASFWLASAKGAVPDSVAEETPTSSTRTNGDSRFVVQSFKLSGRPLADSDELARKLSRHAGMDVGLSDLVKAAADLESELEKSGFSNAVVSIATNQITNGIVILNVFQGLSSRILISGRPYSSAGVEVASKLLAGAGETRQPGNPNAPLATTTNQEPRFVVREYNVIGDTILTTETLDSIFQKYTGTNIGVSDIVKAGSELQMEYRNRGYPTVNVTLPPQQITNGIVKVQVFVGILSEITVVGNRFFSSNNVMRALPSLETNILLSTPVLQAELDRANQNQDRQIYPQIEPGETPNTSALRLEVKDRLPLHAKVELNNQSTPGTPELRINNSAVYNNLWQHEHSLGAQYSFSPEQMKSGDWPAYDRPLVANYSAFYRMPLGNPDSIADTVAARPGNFGYDEGTRKFRLPPSGGITEVSVYGSRSTIDTGLETLGKQTILDVPGVRTITQQDVQQDLTVNQSLGSRLSGPLPEFMGFHSTYSASLDWKSYELTSSKTNIFSFSEITLDQNGNPNPPEITQVPSPVPTTHHSIEYMMVGFHWNASRPDGRGLTFLDIGYNGNLWRSGTRTNLQNISGSKQSDGSWVALTANLGRDQVIVTNWILAMRADAQWASQPLISNEQFGVGGVNSVRGYREGEVFGDCGWRVSLEQKTPAHVVGFVRKSPLTVRGSIFMDYGEAFLLDPNGRDYRVPLWGTGFGWVAALGTHWEARFLFSWPLLDTLTTESYHPRFDFSLGAQF